MCNENWEFCCDCLPFNLCMPYHPYMIRIVFTALHHSVLVDSETPVDYSRGTAGRGNRSGEFLNLKRLLFNSLKRIAEGLSLYYY